MRGLVRLEVDRGQIYGGGVCRDDRRCERARRLRTLRSQDLQPGTAGAPALFWAAEDPAELWERHDGPVACAALEVVQRAVAADESVYGQVAGVVAAGGARLHGVEFRLKAPSSLARKVEAKQLKAEAQGRRLSAERAVDSITDVCRYTAVAAEHDRISEVARGVVEGLTAKGWTVVEAEHSYVEGNPYKGVHVLMREPEGLVVEVQVHSERSQAIKDESHLLYERSRAAETPMGERRRLQGESQQLWSDLPTPAGLDEMGSLGGVTVRKKTYS